MFKKTFITIIILFVLLVVLHPFIFNWMARFIKVQDKLEKADVIMVLAGDSNGERVAHGVDLYKQGYAPKILMSGGPAVWHMTYAENMRGQATSLGVPSSSVYLQDKSKSTVQDIRFSLPILQKLNAKTIILVTSPYHMRRSALVARKYYSKQGIKVIASPVEKSVFDPDKWWTRHEDTAFVMWEYMAMAEYFLKGQLF